MHAEENITHNHVCSCIVELDIQNELKTCTAVFFGHLIAQVFRSLKTQRLRVRIPPEA